MPKPIPETIKIIDFGFANYASTLKAETEGRFEFDSVIPVGTPNYIAPEVLLGERATYMSDTFAIGSILYFMYGNNNSG